MEQSLALENDLTVADGWFAALDQRSFTVNNSRWTTRVLGVHVARSRTWLQLELEQDPERSVLIALEASAGLHDAINAIRAELLRRLLEPTSGLTAERDRQ